MAVERGFVQRIEVGRGGLVTITLVHDDRSTGIYYIRDLDADPERFNERLSRLGILRDAMNRGEPVEVEVEAPSTDKTKAGAQLELARAVRVTRDELDSPGGSLQQVAGLVLDVSVASVNGITSDGLETHDSATIAVLNSQLAPVTLTLDLQAPERLVASQQLDMVREAQSRGAVARFVVQPPDNRNVRLVVAVSVDDDASAFGREAEAKDGFVETLSLIQVPFGNPQLTARIANVRFTTAPPFSGPGNTVANTPFTPSTVTLLVARGSATYELFEAGLRDNLRMRVALGPLPGEGQPTGADAAAAPADQAVQTSDLQTAPPTAPAEGAGAAVAEGPILKVAATEVVRLAIAAELLAPLASASRPVWVTISREMLDRGPEGDECQPGVPSSDLTPQGLRDLRIPYRAEWKGCGCFNDGVYRFQVQLPGECRVTVDDEELCLYDSDQGGVKFAYACLGGYHCVKVVIEEWTCDTDFIFDVYRLR